MFSWCTEAVWLLPHLHHYRSIVLLRELLAVACIAVIVYSSSPLCADFRSGAVRIHSVVRKCSAVVCFSFMLRVAVRSDSRVLHTALNSLQHCFACPLSR